MTCIVGDYIYAKSKHYFRRSNGELTPDVDAHASPEKVVPTRILSSVYALTAVCTTKINGYEVLVGARWNSRIGKEISPIVIHEQVCASRKEVVVGQRLFR